MTATNYTLQIGFVWNSPETEGKRALTYVFLDGVVGYHPDQNTKTYDFKVGDTLTWKIFDLTYARSTRLLCSVDVHYTIKETNGAFRNLIQSDKKLFSNVGYQAPLKSGVGSSGETEWISLKSTNGGTFPYWTPPHQDGHPHDQQFEFAATGTYKFTVTIEIKGKLTESTQTFFLDPEMMVGAGSGTYEDPMGG
jgi:hypothetical protein